VHGEAEAVEEEDKSDHNVQVLAADVGVMEAFVCDPMGYTYSWVLWMLMWKVKGRAEMLEVRVKAKKMLEGMVRSTNGAGTCGTKVGVNWNHGENYFSGDPL
jgi:hypothetical protein